MAPDDTGQALLPIQAVEAGATGNVPAEAIIKIVTPYLLLDAVSNESATSGGRERETVEQFRDRYFPTLNGAGGVNADAIRAAILMVERVEACAIVENDTDSISPEDLPPHSVECIVYGGDATAIAKAICDVKAAGIGTYGSSSHAVTDAGGNLKTIRFSRPEPILIWVKVETLVVDAKLYPEDGDERIRQTVIQHIGASSGSIAPDGLGIGQPVRCSLRSMRYRAFWIMPSPCPWMARPTRLVI